MKKRILCRIALLLIVSLLVSFSVFAAEPNGISSEKTQSEAPPVSGNISSETIKEVNEKKDKSWVWLPLAAGSAAVFLIGGVAFAVAGRKKTK